MPRFDGQRKRKKDLAEYAPYETVLGTVALTVMGEGGYVGLYHTYESGIVFRVHWEDHTERFRCMTSDDFNVIDREIWEWIQECRGTATKKRKGGLL